jgi:hypothetical protein
MYGTNGTNKTNEEGGGEGRVRWKNGRRRNDQDWPNMSYLKND